MKLSTLSKQYIGKEYDLGHCDCFSLVRNYLSDQGVTLPAEYSGIDIVTGYAKLWKLEPEKAKELMVNFFAEFTDKIPSFRMKAGDILHLALGTGHFCGIHAGNGHVMGASPEYGVTLFKISNYQVLGVYRCRS